MGLINRDSFMDVVYTELQNDPDNCRANNIINAADEYAEPDKDTVIQWCDSNGYILMNKDAYEVIFDTLTHRVGNDKSLVPRIEQGTISQPLIVGKLY